jgi:hypothetical protein
MAGRLHGIWLAGNGVAPATGPGDTASYFPSNSGDQWSFKQLRPRA